VDPRTRRELTRYGVPAAFLAAVTIAVLLVRAGLGGGDGSTTTVGALPTTRTTTTSPTTTRLVLTTPTATTTTTTAQEAEYHVVESGDTLGSIAERYDTTIEELVRLNPGVDPTALRVGDRIRVS
jgi:LysM repeat protein